MSEITQHDRCTECGGIFVNGKQFFIIGWVKPTADMTIVEEEEYAFDAGAICVTCYNYRIGQLKQKATRI